MEWLITGCLIVFNLALFGFFIIQGMNKLGEKNIIFTTIEDGGFKFVIQGDSLVKIIDKVDGFFVDQTTYTLVPETKRNDSKYKPRKIDWFEKRTGLIWVGIFFRKVHSFDVVADVLLSESETEASTDLRKLIKNETRRVKYLRVRFPHPTLTSEIELGKDRWKVDVIVMLDIMVVNPKVFVFDYKGKVINQLDAAVRSALINFLGTSSMNYQEFIKADKGPESDVARAILRINDSTSPRRQKDGFKDRFGIQVMSAWIETAELSKEQKELEEAATEVDRQRLLAKAKKTEAKGDQAKERLTRKGVAEGYTKIVQFLEKEGLSKEEIGEILRTRIVTEGIQGSSLTTLVTGGGAVVSLPLNEKKG